MLLRLPQKPVLANAIWALLISELPVITGQVQYVLDDGALVQRIPWKRGSTYNDICQLYTDYVRRKYGVAIVVFDGYKGTSTKDMTHHRRAGGRDGTTVTFDGNMPVTMKKYDFLANKTKTNNSSFICLVVTCRW